jgi:RNA recognition motif-containing protein
LYVGNLNLSTTELEIRTLFSKAGNIKSIKMGIDKKTSGFGGFCFIEYV